VLNNKNKYIILILYMNNFNFNQNQNQNENRLFENSRYSNNRNKKQTFILDVVDNINNGSFTHLSDGTEFTIQLYEPLIIDSHSEVYLDNMITMNSNLSCGSDGNDSEFVLRIKEFNTNTYVASNLNTSTTNYTYNTTTSQPGSKPPIQQTLTGTRNVPGGENMFRGLIIPNDHGSVSNFHSVVVHKSKKFNYVCDINPTRINSITAQITNMNGGPIFHGREPTATNTYALVNIGKTLNASGSGPGFDNASSVFPLREGDTISNISASGSPITATNASGSILSLYTSTNTDEIIFSYGFITDNDLLKFGGTAPITFTITRDIDGTPNTQDVTFTPDPNTSKVGCIRGPGRFTAEFSIVSKD